MLEIILYPFLVNSIFNIDIFPQTQRLQSTSSSEWGYKLLNIYIHILLIEII